MAGLLWPAQGPVSHLYVWLTGEDKVCVTAFDECLIQHSLGPQSKPTKDTQQVCEIFIYYTLH